MSLPTWTRHPLYYGNMNHSASGWMRLNCSHCLEDGDWNLKVGESLTTRKGADTSKQLASRAGSAWRIVTGCQCIVERITPLSEPIFHKSERLAFTKVTKLEFLMQKNWLLPYWQILMTRQQFLDDVQQYKRQSPGWTNCPVPVHGFFSPTCSNGTCQEWKTC